MRNQKRFGITTVILFIALHYSNGFISPMNRRLLLTQISSLSNSNSESTDSIPLVEQYSVVIGKGSAINLEGAGTLNFSDTLLVEGSLIGRLRCLRQDDLDDDQDTMTVVTIGPEGELKADVKCVRHVDVYGTLKGDVLCESLIIRRGASFIGNIIASDIIIEPGSSISGSFHSGTFLDYVDEDNIFTERHNVLKSNENDQYYTSSIVKSDVSNGREPPQSYNNIYSNGNQRMVRSANEYHNMIQKDRIEKQYQAWGVSAQGNRVNRLQKQVELRDEHLIDDFGNAIVSIDKQGKMVDSFGNPLIREANEDEVDSFREIRKMSQDTWNLINTHKRNKEKAASRNNSTIEAAAPKQDDEDMDNLPSFLQQ